MSMEKKYRVTKNQEFQEIIQQKKFVTSNAFALYFVPKKESQARFGISVGKKLGIAVLRNKIKRQLRMMLMELAVNDFGFDVILIVRKDYLQHSYADNKKDLAALLKKVKM